MANARDDQGLYQDDPGTSGPPDGGGTGGATGSGGGASGGSGGGSGGSGGGSGDNGNGGNNGSGGGVVKTLADLISQGLQSGGSAAPMVVQPIDQSGGGGLNLTTVLVVAGLGFAGWFLYKKFGKGGS